MPLEAQRRSDFEPLRSERRSPRILIARKILQRCSIGKLPRSLAAEQRGRNSFQCGWQAIRSLPAAAGYQQAIQCGNRLDLLTRYKLKPVARDNRPRSRQGVDLVGG